MRMDQVLHKNVFCKVDSLHATRAAAMALLPQHCRPIIVTDAGFRGPWFQAVHDLGRDWIGRIRNCINYRLKSRNTWRRTTDLY